MTRTVSVAHAKAELSQCIRWAEDGEPVVITRHGKPVAALVRVEELEHLQRLRAAGPESGLLSLGGGWEGSEALAHLIGRSPALSGSDLPALD
ncbi:MAG: type II toxin-antitoxin system Phd/YefM family antitoxin [Gemmatimonadota bacterium]|nr:MAG: type II toxin-antitoxin system Phd/YefM family antitoxin [Gemmatimonadota bacterium]